MQVQTNFFWGFITSNASHSPEDISDCISSFDKSSAEASNCKTINFRGKNDCAIGIGYSYPNFDKNKTVLKDLSLYEDDNYASVFHGVIYNKSQVLEDLFGLDHRNYDLEEAKIVTQVFQKWGVDGINRLNGRFAYAIINKKDNSVFIGHDRFGKVRLFYYHKDDTLVFSTRIEPLMRFPGIKKQINTEILGYVLRLGYVPTPHCIYRDVHKLESGAVLIYDRNKLTIRRYWQPQSVLAQQKPFSGSFEEALDILNQTLMSAVRVRLDRTKKVGALLSSGIDSSLIAAMVQKELGGGLTTFTIGIHDKKYNEADLARQIANHLGTTHKEYFITEMDLMKCVDKITSLMDEPFGDSGLIPMMVVSQIASEEVDTAFGGDGGDEVFEGYYHYRLVRQAQKYDFLGGLLYDVLPMRIIRKFPHYIQHVILNRNSSIKTQLIIPYEFDIYRRVLSNPIIAPCYEMEDSMNISNWELRRQVLDMQTSFCDDAIQKSDLATRFGGLDLRSPLIDFQVAELSLSLPNVFKSRGAVNKRILRELAYRYVPKKILDLPKRGFCIPIDVWMESQLSEEIRELSSNTFLSRQGIFNGDVLREAMVKDHPLKWNFYVFQKWYLSRF